MKKFLLLILVFCSSGLTALEFSDLSKKLDLFQEKSPVLYDEGDSVFFEEDASKLASLGLQMGAVVMSAEDFAQSKYVHLDLDHLQKSLSRKDQIFIAKTAFVFPGVSPSYFSSERVSTQEYMNRAMHDNASNLVDPREPTVMNTSRRFGVPGLLSYTVQSKIHLAHYNFDKQESRNLTREMSEKFLSLHQVDGKHANLIMTTYSSSKEISTGSKGARTINFYYDINSKDTLHISYKLVTFDVEQLEQVPVKALGGFLTTGVNAWSHMKDSLIRTQQDGTLKSLLGIRSYIIKSSEP